ncbi:MAG: 1-deoxy-D-xylulose-5-phosphate reductoisomerase [Acidobacteria bacterium]|nr:1-deoxy-D-xylulose-5-phosphate reductoisomerase [Candidatus Eremiobacteraeota bacterium]MCB1045229.1 1-deoxy-D-xylulose-5-phosphate reductoisomerase [Acidobacteriota bacterium]
MVKVISILGSTGSIGQSTLKVVRAFPDRFKVKLLAANRQREKLLQQAMEFEPDWVYITRDFDAIWLKNQIGSKKIRVIQGPDQLDRVVRRLRVDVTVAAIVGAAGLRPAMAAMEAGSNLALANKEAMVVAGRLMNQLAQEKDVAIIPVDSEHNAIHQCLRGADHHEVKRLILTASGGPFREFEGDFSAITPQQALKHPTWDMGRKISIDSATLMNKGLEVIEAHYLFGFSPNQIDIVIHPQSIVHSMVEYIDNSYICQLGATDMVHPIQYALTYPERTRNPFPSFDITKGAHLDFYKVDRSKFPCSQLAYDALLMAGNAPAVLNAANEIAVEAFLEERIKFTDIHRVNAASLEKMAHRKAQTLDELIALDEASRRYASNMVQKLG